MIDLPRYVYLKLVVVQKRRLVKGIRDLKLNVQYNKSHTHSTSPFSHYRICKICVVVNLQT
jgi:hypothetical protein